MLYVHYIFADGAREGHTNTHRERERERERERAINHVIKLIYRHFASVNT